MKFYIGAATAAHQVEGNNVNSDFWVMENLEYSSFTEPSLDACDHYNRYQEDIDLMKEAGLNAYRFSIEWARIEPQKGTFDSNELEHYRNVILYCKKQGIEPIVTLHHFSSPAWLIGEGGWENIQTATYFANYAKYIAQELGSELNYICTINEANMGVQIAEVAKMFMRQMGIDPQVGLNFGLPEHLQKEQDEARKILGFPEGEMANTFLSMRTKSGNDVIRLAHIQAREKIKEINSKLQVGLTLSLYDIQLADDSPEAITEAEEKWKNDFLDFQPAFEKDDFLGVQNYTRVIIGKNGVQAAPEDSILTQMGYEFYPQGIANVVRKVAKDFKGKIFVTENGVATEDDNLKNEFIHEALKGLKKCYQDGIPLMGYLYWSLLDNFEWQKGFGMKFGLIGVDRENKARQIKPSLHFLGNTGKQIFESLI
ncbi:glycoside hydrolase family 1 protein [Aerococcaceae bacterium zg-ZUI334]|uniref:glycoside hydrolase family 1 protein n=1 Tax=Aerococcaceae TaxID=186827 RepID=UPI0013B8CB2E|nr:MULTISPECIES: family 1 glycosylhydrolase [unclassified Facklamia]MBR7926874.1 glycoside hydrolase family 1 protein [Aerococcaceae bacterium zg-ZUI334]NEW64828.1 family 1 glycosylhydrolase [Facklamia sp. 252]NEW68150.1 family 1 glycosylhydrolase [Facklamia sp. 253]QQD64981.1 glycoside hydrolase family 1 protein [Aerococcaceae bacterium zg-252]